MKAPSILVVFLTLLLFSGVLGHTVKMEKLYSETLEGLPLPALTQVIRENRLGLLLFAMIPGCCCCGISVMLPNSTLVKWALGLHWLVVIILTLLVLIGMYLPFEAITTSLQNGTQ